jgi:hypothetical protein
VFSLLFALFFLHYVGLLSSTFLFFPHSHAFMCSHQMYSFLSSCVCEFLTSSSVFLIPLSLFCNDDRVVRMALLYFYIGRPSFLHRYSNLGWYLFTLSAFNIIPCFPPLSFCWEVYWVSLC